MIKHPKKKKNPLETKFRSTSLVGNIGCMLSHCYQEKLVLFAVHGGDSRREHLETEFGASWTLPCVPLPWADFKL